LSTTTEAIVARGLSKAYRMPAGTGMTSAVTLPFPGWPTWLRYLTLPVRVPLAMARAPFLLGARALGSAFFGGHEVRALDGLNLTIFRGEVFGLLGPNGAGKTTTINLLLGLIWPTFGKCWIFGRSPGDLAVRRKLGYLPEETYLYRHLNAIETLEFYGRLFGMPRQVLRKRIDELLDLVGLDANARKRPLKTYSKGMARRIGLAQSLINDPDLVILDEPTSGLDPLGSNRMKEIIQELKRKGKTILMCSHLLGDVQDVCDRVAVLHRGAVLLEGRVDELCRERDVWQLQAGGVSPELAARVREIVEADGAEVLSADCPRNRLEDLFIRAIAEAESHRGAIGGPTAGAPASSA